jgi:hypothetical protein
VLVVGLRLGGARPALADDQCKPAAPLPQSKCTNDAQCCAGLVCAPSGGDTRCQSGCRIGGLVYASGAVNTANQCQSCQPAVSKTAWSNLGAGPSCNDGNACTDGDHCSAGTCVGTPVVCNAPGACETATGASCSAGVCSYPAAVGKACDDGNACTTGDQCNGTKQCAGTPVVCNAPGACQTATEASCSAGACSYPAAVGKACDDGNACTQSDTCQAGACMSGAAVDCGPGNRCDPSQGCLEPCGDTFCPAGACCTTGNLASGMACVSACSATTGRRCLVDSDCGLPECVDCQPGETCRVQTCADIDLGLADGPLVLGEENVPLTEPPPPTEDDAEDHE